MRRMVQRPRVTRTIRHPSGDACRYDPDHVSTRERQHADRQRYCNSGLVRSEHESFFRLGARTNRFLLWTVLGTFAVQISLLYFEPARQAPHLQPLAFADLLIVLATSTGAFWAIELEKLLLRRRQPKTPSTIPRGGTSAPAPDACWQGLPTSERSAQERMRWRGDGREQRHTEGEELSHEDSQLYGNTVLTPWLPPR